MSFRHPGANAVLEHYERRRANESRRMAALPPAQGMALRDEFLLAVGPETGWFLHSLVVAARPALILELGTSFGYSTLFLADAAKQIGGRIISMDCALEKQQYADLRLQEAGLHDVVEFVTGDAVEEIENVNSTIDFVLLDIWKELYVPCFKAFYPKISTRGLIVADNMIFPPQARTDVREFRKLLEETPDLDSTLLPIGSGIELACRWPAGHSDL